MKYFFSRCESPVKQQSERNRLWAARLRVVRIMEGWLRDHVKSDVDADGVSDVMHVHIMVGKALHPSDDRDALFTLTPFENEHMAERLRAPGLCVAFREELARLHQQLVVDTPPAPPTWAEVHPLVESSAGRSQLGRMKTLLELDGHAMDLVEQVLIGLVLRYTCVGGFDSSALHASVPASWSQAFQGFTDCFASPMQHVLPSYHSLFDEDSLYFHSKGNFFRGRGSKLPAGCYHMHPPDIPCVHEEIHRIVQASLPAVTMKIVLVAPSWAAGETIAKKWDRLVTDEADAGFKLEIPRMPLVHLNGFCLTSPAVVFVVGAFPSRSRLVQFFYQQV